MNAGDIYKNVFLNGNFKPEIGRHEGFNFYGTDIPQEKGDSVRFRRHSTIKPNWLSIDECDKVLANNTKDHTDDALEYALNLTGAVQPEPAPYKAPEFDFDQEVAKGEDSKYYDRTLRWDRIDGSTPNMIITYSEKILTNILLGYPKVMHKEMTGCDEHRLKYQLKNWRKKVVTIMVFRKRKTNRPLPDNGNRILSDACKKFEAYGKTPK